MTETQNIPTQDRTASANAVPSFADILCAVDGKEGGFTAVEQAATLAGPQGHLTFLLVTSFRAEGAYRGAAINAAQATGVLERATRIAEEAHVPCASEVDPATPPSKVILEWSAEYDLLALGAPATSWLTGMASAGVGDTALAVLMTPVLVARSVAGDRHFADHILVASDCLDASDALVDLATGLAKARGAKVTLLHAVGHESPIRRHRSEQMGHRFEEQGRRLERALAAGTTEARLEPGHAHDVIAAAAASVGASLVVMGSRRLDGLRAIGSVSRRVAHEAHCSVLLVPPEKLAR